MKSINLGSLVNRAFKPLGYALAPIRGGKDWRNIDVTDLGVSIAYDDQDFSLRTEGPKDSELTLPAEDLPNLVDLSCYRGKRVLEIGPKTGIHTRWIDKEMSPSFFCMVELPMREAEMNPLPNPSGDTKLIYSDIFSASQLRNMDKFDFIFCIGVFYHTVEQIKLLRFLGSLLAEGGTMLFQSTALKVPGSFVDLRWSPSRQGNYAIPTVEAVFRMLAMTGWNDLTLYTKYRPRVDAILVSCGRRGQPPLSYSGAEFGSSSV